MSQSKRKGKSIDNVNFGLEPSPETIKINSSTDLIIALNWYNYMKDSKTAKKYATTSFSKSFPEIRKIPDYELRTIGWIARLTQRGFELEEEIERAKEKLILLVNKHTNTVEKIKTKPPTTITIQDRIKRKNEDTIAELESVVDEWILNPKFKFDPYKWMVENEVTSIGAKYIMEYYSEWSKEEKFIDAIVKAAGQITDNSKIVRKARKKRKPNVENLVKKFQYQENDDELRLQSIAPAQILEAKELWMYNTKTRLLTVLRGEGLTIKGTTVYGWDEENSVAKMLRKPIEILPLLTTKTKAKKTMNMLNTKPKSVNGRSGKETILLRIFK